MLRFLGGHVTEGSEVSVVRVRETPAIRRAELLRIASCPFRVGEVIFFALLGLTAAVGEVSIPHNQVVALPVGDVISTVSLCAQMHDRSPPYMLVLYR
jgi:hypothetical protein